MNLFQCFVRMKLCWSVFVRIYEVILVYFALKTFSLKLRINMLSIFATNFRELRISMLSANNPLRITH